MNMINISVILLTVVRKNKPRRREKTENYFVHVVLTFPRAYLTLLSLATAQSSLDVHGFLVSTLINKPSVFVFRKLVFW